jgi:hypothetical protein
MNNSAILINIEYVKQATPVTRLGACEQGAERVTPKTSTLNKRGKTNDQTN